MYHSKLYLTLTLSLTFEKKYLLQSREVLSICRANGRFCTSTLMIDNAETRESLVLLQGNENNRAAERRNDYLQKLF